MVNSHLHPDFKFAEVSEAYACGISTIRQLKTGKAVGLDNIPARLLVDSVDIVVKPLIKIINMSLHHGGVPLACMKSDDDDISTASNNEHTQSSEAIGSESGSGSEVENESDPWEPLIEEAKERNVSEYEEIKQNFIERGLDEESASSQAYSLILPKLQKDLESIYLERLFWMRQLRKNRVHRKVMNKRDEFINSDDFDHDEALEAAVDKKKFLLKRLLKDNTFIEGENADNDVD